MAAGLLLGPGRTADGGADSVTVLRNATAKIVGSIERAPKYACRETIVRRYYRTIAPQPLQTCVTALEEWRNPTAGQVLRLYSEERLRLDVILTSQGEIYSWPDARRFEDGGLGAMVPYGPFNTGVFAGFLAAVFAVDVKKFEFAGREQAARTT